MSRTIDERVVSMQFDNRQFEKNVATSMSTLDKLKKALNLDKSGKAFDNLNAAAKKCNFSPLMDAADKVSLKFSGWYTVADQALRRITDAAFNYGKRMVSALTIDPVKTGFNEYELKMGSIQTIMASTGESLDTVNQYLNELNTYSDQTIYSFQDMTQNIGKFTNAGVKLEDAVAAIKGISNEAAVSGANANEASRAMYNFAQALSAGYVKLVDWKSIELANMATLEFKNQLIETAVGVGTLKDNLDGTYTTLEGRVISATKNFNDSLQDQWMTSEVLISTLKKYADSETDIGKKATEAATKVKKFSQLMDTLKESAQSGWAQTWELLVGDFEQARNLFTVLSEKIGGLISKMSDFRNNALYDSMTSGWDKLIDKINKAGVSTEQFEKAIEKVGTQKLGSAFKDLLQEYGSLEELFKSGAVSSDLLKDAMDELGTTVSKTSKITAKFTLPDNKLMYARTKDGIREVQQALKDLGYDIGEVDGQYGELTKSAVKAFQKANNCRIDGIVGPETLGALKEACIIIEETGDAAVELGDDCYEAADGVTELGGRAKLLKTFVTLGEKLAPILNVIKEAWNKVFGDILSMSETIDFVIDKLYEFVDGIKISQETLDKLSVTIEGFFRAIELAAVASGGIFGILSKITKYAIKLVGADFLTLTARIGQMIIDFRSWLFETNDLSLGIQKVAESFVDFVQRTITGIQNWFDGFKKILGETGMLSKITEPFDVLVTAVVGFFNNINIAFSKFLDTIFKMDKVTFDGLVSAAEQLGKDLIAPFKNFPKLVEDCLHAAEIAVIGFFAQLSNESGTAEEFVKKFEAIKVKLSGLIEGFSKLADSISKLFGAIKNLGLAIINLVQSVFVDLGNSASESSDSIITMFASIFGGLTIFVDKITSAITALTDWINAMQNVENKAKYIFDGIAKALGYLLDSWSSMFDAISEYVNSGALGISNNLVLGLVNGLISGMKEIGSAIIGVATYIIETACKILGIHSPSTVFMTLGLMCIAGLVLGLTGGGELLGTTIGGLFDGFISNVTDSGLFEAIKTYFGKIIDYVKGISFGQIFALSGLGALLFFVWQIKKALDLLATGVKGLNGLIDSAKGVLKSLSGAITDIGNAVKTKANAKAFKDVAIGIAVLAASIAGLVYVTGDNPLALWNAVGAVLALSVIIGGLYFALNKISTLGAKINKDGKKINISFSKLAHTLFSVGVAVLAVAASAKIIGSMEDQKFDQAIKGILSIGGIIAALAVLSKLTIKTKKFGLGGSGNGIENIGKMMSKIANAMLKMTVALWTIGLMNADDFHQATSGLSLLAILIGGLMLIAKVISRTDAGNFSTGIEKLDHIGKMVKAIATAMLIMSASLWVIGHMDVDDYHQATSGFTLITILIGALMLVTKAISRTEKGNFSTGIEKLDHIGKMILAIGAAMGIMAVAIDMMGSLTPDEYKQGIIGLGLMSLMVVALMALTKVISSNKFVGTTSNIDNVGKTLLSVAGAMAIMAVVAKIMGSIGNDEWAHAVDGLVGLSALIGGLMVLTRFAGGSDLTGVGSTLMKLAIAVGVMSGAVILLSLVQDGLFKGVAAIVALSAAMALMIRNTRGASECKSNLLMMTIAIGVMAAAIAALSFIPDTNKLAAAVAAIGILMGVFAIVIKDLGTANTSSPMKNLIAMAGMMVVLGGVLTIVGGLNPGNSIAAAGSLAGLLLILTACMRMMANARVITKDAMISVGILAGVMVALAACLKMLGQENWASMLSAAVSLGVVLLAMTVAMNLLGGSSNIKGAASLLVLSVALIAIAGALKLLAGVPFGQLAGAAIVIGVLVGVLALLANVCGTAAPGAAVLARIMLVLCAVLLSFSVAAVAVGVAATLLAEALYRVGEALPLIADGFVAIIQGIANCAGYIDNFKMVMGALRDGILGLSVALLAAAAAIVVLSLALLVATPGLAVGTVAVIALSAAFVLLGTSLAIAALGIAAFAAAFVISIALIVGVISGIAEAMFGIGGDIVDGLANGVSSAIGSVVDAISGIGGGIIDTICSILQINSPSKVMEWVGQMIGDGLTNGISGSEGEVENAVSGLANTVTQGDTFNDAGAQNGSNYIAGLTEQLNIPIDGSSIDITQLTAGLDKGGAQGGTDFMSSLTEQLEVPLDGNNMDLSNLTSMIGDKGGESGKLFNTTLNDSIDVSSIKLDETEVAAIETSYRDAGTKAGTAFSTALSEMTVTNDANFASAGSNLIQAFARGISSQPSSNTAIDNIIYNVINRIRSNYPSFMTEGKAIITQFSTGIMSQIGSINFAISSTISTALILLTSTAPNFIIAGMTLMTYLSLGILSGSTIIGIEIELLLSGLLVKIQSKNSEFENAGCTFVTKLIGGIKKNADGISDAFKNALSDAKTKIRDYYEDFYDAGGYLVDGFAAGISANTFKAEAEAAAMANAAYKAAMEELDSNSPSKLFMKVGGYVASGFAIGIGNGDKEVKTAATSMADTAIDATKNAISMISDAIRNDIDTQPTIRPVLDLTNVEAGSRRLSAIFSRSQAMSVSSGMNRSDTSSISDGNPLSKIGNTFQFTQNNYSPKALSRDELYRQTKNQFSTFERMVEA